MLLHWTVPNCGDHYDVDLAKFYHCPCCVHWPFTCANKLLLYPIVIGVVLVKLCSWWVQVVQQQLAQQASLHSAELSQTAFELQQTKSALAAAQSHTLQLQVRTMLQHVASSAQCDCLVANLWVCWTRFAMSVCLALPCPTACSVFKHRDIWLPAPRQQCRVCCTG